MLHAICQNVSRSILGKVGKVDRACSEDRGATPTGDGCAALIMLDGWQIAKDYPW